MWIARTIEEARRRRSELAGQVAFVPTMGALHKGHASLVHYACGIADAAVVSIFVNPAQFGPSEDFASYPRTLDEDLAMCRQAGAKGVFVPEAGEIYPPGQIDIALTVPTLAQDLEATFRPGHFPGVCRVVAKLFNIISPDFAIFGRKDYQQWKIIEAMARDLAMPVKVVGLPTVRDADGLAMSSRNRYLSPDLRIQAAQIYQSLQMGQARFREDARPPFATAELAMREHLVRHGFQIDYASIRHAETLAPFAGDHAHSAGQKAVALIAARLGAVRLIDNLEFTAA